MELHKRPEKIEGQKYDGTDESFMELARWVILRGGTIILSPQKIEVETAYGHTQLLHNDWVIVEKDGFHVRSNEYITENYVSEDI